MERGTHPLLDRFRQIEAVVQNGLLEIKYLAVALMGSGDGVDEEQEDRFIADLTRCIGHIEMSLIEDAAGIDRYDYSTTSGDGYSSPSTIQARHLNRITEINCKGHTIEQQEF